MFFSCRPEAKSLTTPLVIFLEMITFHNDNVMGMRQVVAMKRRFSLCRSIGHFVKVLIEKVTDFYVLFVMRLPSAT